MERDLTKRYSAVFDSHRLNKPLSFVRDVYSAGKWRELISFAAWESLHKLRLFPSREYLRFTDHTPVALGPPTDMDALTDAFRQSVAGLGLHATKCPHTWKAVHLRPDDGLIGCLYPNDNELHSSDDGVALAFVEAFCAPIKAIFISTAGTVFVCVKGAVFRRAANARTFERVLELASSESFFRHNNAMTEAPGGILVAGEYGNVWRDGRWVSLAYLYFSYDDGLSWTASDTLIRHGANKHVHVVKYSKLTQKLLVADGDNYKKLWVGDNRWIAERRQPIWTAANRFHIQMGGYTSVVESDGKVLFGTDYQGGTNFIVESSDCATFTKQILPDPYRRSPVDNMVVRRSRSGRSEIWANLPYSTAGSKCLLMCSQDGGGAWHRIFEYSRSAHVVWLISSSVDVAPEVYASVQDLTGNSRAVYKIGDKE